MLAGKSEPLRQMAAVLSEKCALRLGKFGRLGPTKLLQQIKSAASKSQQFWLNPLICTAAPTEALRVRNESYTSSACVHRNPHPGKPGPLVAIHWKMASRKTRTVGEH
jgi:hypothetical protein